MTTRHIAASTNKALFGKSDGVGKYDSYCPNLGAVRESDMNSAIDGRATQPANFEFMELGAFIELRPGRSVLPSRCR